MEVEGAGRGIRAAFGGGDGFFVSFDFALAVWVQVVLFGVVACGVAVFVGAMYVSTVYVRVVGCCFLEVQVGGCAAA